MREIKFRAWDEKNNCFRSNDMTLSILQDAAITGMEGYVVEQFTGLTDKDGKEVYDGDLFNFDGGIAKVEWCDDLSCYLAVFTDGSDLMLFAITHRCAVIGNIHEHKHLLDGEES